MRYLCAVMLCIFLLCGCVRQTPLRQPTEKIVQIELIDRRDASELVLISTLTGDQITYFMEELEKLECSKRFQPIEDFNELEIRIYYSTGDMDLLGSGANGYVDDGAIQTSGWYYYPEEELAILFAAYSN